MQGYALTSNLWRQIWSNELMTGLDQQRVIRRLATLGESLFTMTGIIENRCRLDAECGSMNLLPKENFRARARIEKTDMLEKHSRVGLC